MTASVQIERFLRDNPNGRLCVLVGFASTAGLAWLAERTRDRPVTLLIGDTRSKNFYKATAEDREVALAFLDRLDVTVRNWYRTANSNRGKSELHAKSWIVEPSKVSECAILLGSANLTNAGLLQNIEMVALAAEREHERLRSEAKRVLADAWDCKQRLRDTIASAGAVSTRAPRRRPSYAPRRSAPHGQRSRARHRAQAKSAAGQGCATSIALICTGLAALTAALASVTASTVRRFLR